MTTKVATGRVRELRAALQEKATLIEGLATKITDETGNGQFVMDAKSHAAYVDAVDEAEKIRGALLVEEKAAGIFEFLNAPAGPTVGGQDAAESHRPQVKSLGQSFMDSDAFQEIKAAGFRRPSASFTIEGMSIERKDVYSAMGGTVAIPAIGEAMNLGWTERTLRPGRVRDLFPAETTTAAMLYGIRQTGFVNNAATVPERRAADETSAPTGGPTDVYGRKPKSDIVITPVTYPIATIAHIMYVHRNTLADEPRLRGLIDRDMVDGVKMVEDEQLLYGDGVGENLTGLANTPGIQTYIGVNTDRKSNQVRRAITRAILAYHQPTGVVLHPLDWEDLELEEAEDGHFRIAVSVAVGAEKRLWRLPVVDTPACLEGDFFLGAFGTAAKVYDREQVNIELSTENRDLFERNAVTLRCEERVGLVVDRPEAMVYGSFTAFTG
jgi:hypothetical protein